MKRFVFIILFWLASATLVLAEVVNTEAESTYSVEIGQVRGKLQTIEVDLARLSGVNDELGAVRREMSDALMQISNFLAVADRTMDAASASISAADAATNASHSYLAWTGIIVAVLSIGAAILTIYLTRRTVESISDEILTQLKKPLKVNGDHDISIVEKIKRSVYDDLYDDFSSENFSAILQNESNLMKFEEFIERAVEQKLAKMKSGGEFEFLSNSFD